MRTANWLSLKRKEAGLTQKELADKVNLSVFAIQKIERGERLGSPKTWEIIENFFDTGEARYSYNNADIINEIKEEMVFYDKNTSCYLIYKVIDEHIIFVDYVIKDLADDFNLEKDEKMIETTLEYALEVFEDQNKLF